MPPFKQIARRTTRHQIHESGEIIPEAMLNDEFSRMLILSNDYEGRRIIRFNFSSHEFKPITTFDPATVLIEGSIDYKQGEESSLVAVFSEDVTLYDDETNEKVEVVPKLVRNQFNYSDKGLQTLDPRSRDRIMETEPPATATFSANSSPGTIYDAYINQNKKPVYEIETYPTTLNPNVNRLASVAERMVIQNLYDHLLQDFKYYEDPADDVRGQIGCLLPLWKFTSELTKYLSVTNLCWHPQYSDLFAVTFGSFTFSKEGEGAILLYSLKNPSYPTYCFPTDCAVMSVDIHRKFPNYVCAGFCDGGVAFYNLCHNTRNPEKRSERGVHNMHIAQMQWDHDLTDNLLSFYSISPDGVIVKWTSVKNGLKHHVLVTLDISDFVETSMTEMKAGIFGSGITFDFHATQKHLYLVGTEMGHAHICSRTHSAEALQTFDAHHSSIYKIAWNRFHPKVFITCSEDWTVKIWENVGIICKPLLVFDLGSQVYDVEWAPFSSTVFAAVTANGEVILYDIAVDKNEPLCVQVVVFLKNTRIMHLAFNQLYPILLVGDDRGEVTCLKLSPNLRKGPKDKKLHVPTDKKDKDTLEITRLDDILATVREKSG